MMTDKEMKKLKKQIADDYSKHMHGIQVKMQNLSKVSNTVLNCVMNDGMTIEEGYEEAKKLYREN